jgi:hypothetical protein
MFSCWHKSKIKLRVTPGRIRFVNGKQTTNEERTSALTFPCDFVIKMMGKNNDDFRNAAKSIIEKHIPQDRILNSKEVPSKDDNYVALSIKVEANDQAELDACYQALTDEPLVLIAL